MRLVIVEYNKLIRDRIPEIIKESGKTCEIETLSEAEYQKHLNQKLGEELEEYLSSQEVEELADLEEVLRAILDFKGITYEEFDRIRKDKAEKRGAFKKRLLLKKVD